MVLSLPSDSQFRDPQSTSELLRSPTMSRSIRKNQIPVRHLEKWDGFRNNHGFAVPSLDLVFIRLGLGYNYPKNFESDLVKKVLGAVEK